MVSKNTSYRCPEVKIIRLEVADLLALSLTGVSENTNTNYLETPNYETETAW